MLKILVTGIPCGVTPTLKPVQMTVNIPLIVSLYCFINVVIVIMHIILEHKI